MIEIETSALLHTAEDAVVMVRGSNLEG